MRDDLRGAVRALAMPTVGLLGVAALAPGRLELALRIYALVLAGVVIVLALLALRRAFPNETALVVTGTPQRRPQRPPSLTRVENEVVLGIASSFDLHYRLVPRVRSVATGLLASRRIISLEADRERARAMLGTDAWELVRPDRTTPRDRLTTGIRQRDLERIVDALEAL
ncbi:MAG TPA: hypothetical protein VMK83_12075 [Gaiellaceae bacterium]|nr:hypothetical protein [Gaiellaceae bacterium]